LIPQLKAIIPTANVATYGKMDLWLAGTEQPMDRWSGWVQMAKLLLFEKMVDLHTSDFEQKLLRCYGPIFQAEDKRTIRNTLDTLCNVPDDPTELANSNMKRPRTPSASCRERSAKRWKLHESVAACDDELLTEQTKLLQLLECRNSPSDTLEILRYRIQLANQKTKKYHRGLEDMQKERRVVNGCILSLTARISATAHEVPEVTELDRLLLADTQVIEAERPALLAALREERERLDIYMAKKKTNPIMRRKMTRNLVQRIHALSVKDRK
jgi:DNA repair ATPase RecN